MRIALISNCPPQPHPLSGGVGVYTFSLFKALQRLEDVETRIVYTQNFSLNLREKDVNESITFLSGARWTPLNHLFNYFINPLRLPKFDLYHITTQSLGTFARFNHPSIVTVHDITPIQYTDMLYSPYRKLVANTLFYHFAEKSVKVIKYADAISCPSKFTKEELVKTLGVTAQKIKVIPNGVDHEVFKPRDKGSARKKLGLPPNKKIILHVGDEAPRKNVQTVIKALHKLRLIDRYNDNVLLVRIGEHGDPRVTTQKIIKELRLENHILYFHSLGDEELAHFYNAADLLIFPSIYEGFGLPPLEAMASGCPVIAGNRTSVPEVIANAGILFDPLDAKVLAEKIEELLEDEELQRDLIDKGLKRTSGFSWEKCAEETVKLYRKLCA